MENKESNHCSEISEYGDMGGEMTNCPKSTMALTKASLL